MILTADSSTLNRHSGTRGASAGLNSRGPASWGDPNYRGGYIQIEIRLLGNSCKLSLVLPAQTHIISQCFGISVIRHTSDSEYTGTSLSCLLCFSVGDWLAREWGSHYYGHDKYTTFYKAHISSRGYRFRRRKQRREMLKCIGVVGGSTETPQTDLCYQVLQSEPELGIIATVLLLLARQRNHEIILSIH